jgi:hypothetical protein
MISPDDKRRKLMIVTRRLIIFASLSVLTTALLFAVSLVFRHRLMTSWLTFECGLIGGFVSIQQRLRTIDEEELALLTESWAAVLIVPIYGAIFALVLYVIFLSGLLQGHLFPAFYIPPFADAPTVENLRAFLAETYPKSGPDCAKLIFWAFVAGFSERFVPQIVGTISKGVQSGTESTEGVRGKATHSEPARISDAAPESDEV